MQSGYILAYKDKDSFKVAFIDEHDGNPLGKITVYINSHQANEARAKKKKELAELLAHGNRIETTTGMLWWKKTIMVPGPKMSEDIYRYLKRIHDTILVKQVKLA